MMLHRHIVRLIPSLTTHKQLQDKYEKALTPV